MIANIIGIPQLGSGVIIASGVPVNVDTPVISGVEKVGNTITVDTGGWTNVPTSYAYQWYRDSVLIGGATSNSFNLTSTDYNTILYCTVIASNSFGAGSPAQSDNTTAILPAVPVNTVAPALSGTQQVGNILTSSTGTWTTQGSTSYTYQWKRGGTNISSATASTYTLTSTDYNTIITCNVTATNAGGAASQISSSSSAILPAIPVNTVAPVISGTETEGQTLSVTTGTWTSQASISYTYQWKRNSVNIGSATSNTYLLVSADVSTVITCNVTATNSGGAASQISNSTGSIASGLPSNTVVPAITGTAKVGNTLTSSTGTWTNSPTGYTYQWKRGGSNISSATSSTYDLVSADYNTIITIAVIASNTIGSGSAATSSGTSAVLPANPVNTVAPAITGTEKVGSVLTCSTGTWTSQATPSYAYQWKRDGSNIGSATSSTYTLTTSDYNTVITCNVTATNTGGSTSQISNSTGAILPLAPVNTVAPAITGTEQEAFTLTCSTGTWTGQGSISYAYQWKRNGSNISSATSSTYLLVSADVGTTTTCNVTATNSGGSTSQISNTTGTIVIGVPVNSVAPVISGSTTVGSTLTTTNGTWSNSPSSYTYQWKRAGSNIGSATASTYVLVEADITQAITCIVVAVNAGGSGTGTSSNTITPPALSVPTFVSKGTRATGTGNATPGMPSGHTTNDILLLVVEAANETVTAPTGYTAVLNSPQGVGTAGAIGSVAISVFWKRDGGSETSPTITDPGDHQNAQLFCFRGCPTSGNPWSDSQGGSNITATTAFSGSGPTTLVHNELTCIIVCVGSDASTTRFNTANNMAGTGLTNIVNQEDQCSTSGNGGGIALWTATAATPGAITSLTATCNGAAEMAWLTISLKPT